MCNRTLAGECHGETLRKWRMRDGFGTSQDRTREHVRREIEPPSRNVVFYEECVIKLKSPDATLKMLLVGYYVSRLLTINNIINNPGKLILTKGTNPVNLLLNLNSCLQL